jgi:predicted nucleic acid-binding Zn ribbon protein
MEIKIIKKICPVCKTEFETNSQTEKTYCSKECREINQKNRNSEKYNKLKNIQYEERECQQCHKDFIPKNKYQIYCNNCKSCISTYDNKKYNKAKNKMIKKICINCKEKFYTKDISQNFCSIECFKEYNKPTIYIKKCPICNKKFNTNIKNIVYCEDCRKPKIKKCSYCFKEYISKTPLQKYCSKQCSGLAHRKNKTKYCLQCNRPFDYKHPTQKFCCPKCALDYRRGIKVEKRDIKSIKEIVEEKVNYILNQYNEQLSNLDFSVLQRPINIWLTGGFTETIKDQVRERDGWKCFICDKDTELHVHHILERESGGKNELGNLVTLCSGCHRTIESTIKYGAIDKAINKCTQRAINNYKLGLIEIKE